MIKFVNEKFDLNKLKEKELLLVIDTNMQGVWEFNELKHIKETETDLFKQYMEMCFKQNYHTGSASILKGDLYFALLLTKKYLKSNKHLLLENFSKAIDDLFIKIPSDVWIASPILGRHDKVFTDYYRILMEKVKKENRNWFIYRGK